MKFAPEYVSSLIIVLVAVLKLFKVQVGTEEITNIIGSLITAIGGIIIIVKRQKVGDINSFGQYKPKEPIV